MAFRPRTDILTAISFQNNTLQGSVPAKWRTIPSPSTYTG